MIYRELGRLTIKCEIKKRMIKFWIRLIDANNYKLSNKIYQVLLNMPLANIYSSPWICAIEIILNSCGLIFGYKCFNYKLYKQTFGFEKYFDIFPYQKYFIFAKFRT